MYMHYAIAHTVVMSPLLPRGSSLQVADRAHLKAPLVSDLLDEVQVELTHQQAIPHPREPLVRV